MDGSKRSMNFVIKTLGKGNVNYETLRDSLEERYRMNHDSAESLLKGMEENDQIEIYKLGGCRRCELV